MRAGPLGRFRERFFGMPFQALPRAFFGAVSGGGRWPVMIWSDRHYRPEWCIGYGRLGQNHR